MKNRTQIISKLSYLLILCIVGCNTPSSHEQSKSVQNQLSILADPDSVYQTQEAIFNQDSIDFYIDKIAKINEVHSAHSGIVGSKSQVYIAYEKLKDNIEIKDLFTLLKHDSAAVRVYAYLAIEQIDSTQTEKAWSEILGKQEKVNTLNGCIGMSETIEAIIKGYH